MTIRRRYPTARFRAVSTARAIALSAACTLTTFAAPNALIDAANPTAGWSFDNGREFPGAKGSLAADHAVEAQYRPALQLAADFTGGGNYVQMGRTLAADLDTLSFRLQAPEGMKSLTLRLVDGSGQCHQFNLRIEAHGGWQRVLFPVARYFANVGTSASVDLVTRYEGWGGKKDGQWHPPAKSLNILLGRHAVGEALKGSIRIAQVQWHAETDTAGKPYRESFDEAKTLPEGWVAQGPKDAVRLASEAPFEGAHALRLERLETQLTAPVSVVGTPFPAAAGPWITGGALRSDLHSPDNSFAVRLDIEALDASDAVLESITLVDQTGSANWKPFTRPVEFPQGTSRARFALAFHKTHGWCDVDALSATPQTRQSEEKLVERIVIGNRVVGNLFLPEEDVVFDLDVQSARPLPEGEHRALVTVRDYWGAEQRAPIQVALTSAGRSGTRHRHTGEIRIPHDGLEIGKYYEVHVAVPLTGYRDGAEFSGFARLPEAESRRHPAEKIPFSIRNWDSRIPMYFKLASRLGLRQIGTWGDSGWETIRDLGNVWYGGPGGVSHIEREGWQGITEKKLRQNAIDFMTKHKDNQFLAFVVLGNEPNERPERIPEKIRAYQIAYEALKSVKPDVKVVTTSVPALDSFFEAGYHKYTDVYDFHVYETYDGVRRAIRRYRELGRKYGAEKPIWCTELGLNSQGQTRLAVAHELVKKITAFFAEGGENVSWFTIMYPDPDGKARGTSSNAHDVFDCQYSQYNPRLDAIMYYAMVNGIAAKAFVDEVQHADGVQSFLFRDETGDCLHVLWREGERVDRAIPLPGVDAAQLVRIDGSASSLASRNGHVSLGLSGEPAILRYRQPTPAPLARELTAPALSIPNQPLTVLKGQTRTVRATGPGLAADAVRVLLPPRWTAEVRQDGVDAVACTVTAPAETEARMGRVMIQRLRKDGVPCAEIALSLAIMSPVSVEILAAPPNAAGEPEIRAILRNNGSEPAPLSWAVELTGAAAITNGMFHLTNLAPPQSAYIKGDTEGFATLAPGEVREARVAIAAADPQTIYRARAAVADAAGRRVTRERYAGGFATAARTPVPVTIDGALNDAVWSRAAPARIDSATAAYRFKPGTPWRGTDDLSATWRAAWDADALYLAVEVTDDVHRVQFANASIWNQDGLQLLIDPARVQDEKSGKYDYSLAAGTQGPQAWCHLSAHSSVAEGEASDIRMATAALPGSTGGKIYEVAIPWSRLAPFEPKPGANLGINMILNEDDGNGRIGYSGWFSGAHTKDMDQVGDLILSDE